MEKICSEIQRQIFTKICVTSLKPKDLFKLRELTSGSSPYNPILTQIIC